jgi:hypothetical protein
MRNNTNLDPQPSQPHQAPPAGMEQFLAAQTQLLTNMANTIANMQAQMNQAPPPPPPWQRRRPRNWIKVSATKRFKAINSRKLGRQIEE